jgi:glycosyltransferase involved in cell wall biosynthesis
VIRISSLPWPCSLNNCELADTQGLQLAGLPPAGDHLEIEVVIKACFIGSARYSQPLDTTSEKKFRALKPLGELFVIGFSQDLRPRRFTQHSRFYLLPKLPLPVLRYAEMFVLGPLLALWLIFRQGVRVLVAQSPYEGVAGALTKKVADWLGYNVALVVESHGDFEESLFIQRRIRLPRCYRFLMRRVAGFTLREANVLRAVSHSTGAQLERWVSAKPLMQFPAWTDIKIFLQAGLNNLNFPTQDILYAGVLTPLKGVHHLINAFASIAKDFPQARLILVGREENQRYVTALKDQVSRYGLGGRAEFVKEMPQADLAERMRSACVFVLPSTSEGLGRVVVEAMAAGTPVIGSDVGGIPEMVKNGVTGWLVPSEDEIMLADRLRWVLEHPHEAHDMGRYAHGFAESFFSTEAYVNGYRQIFEASQTML